MSMSKKLDDLVKERNKEKLEEKRRNKRLNPKLAERDYDMLRILRTPPTDPTIKYNAKYFEKRFGVSEVTIYRMVKKLKDMDLLEEKQKGGSYVIKNEVEQLYTEKTEEDIALVASLRGLLQHFEHTPLFEKVTKLIYFLQPKVAKNDSLLSSGRVIVAPQIEYDIRAKNWDLVNEALKENYKIKFRYTKIYSNNKSQRTVCPYQLILDNGVVYLFAYSEYADNIILYDLNFMADIIVTDEKFTLPKNYDFNNYSGGGRLGAFKEDKIQNFKIRFTGYAKDWMKYHKWANDQQIKAEDQDSLTITFSSAQEFKVLREVLKWGTDAQPLAPKSLVKRWREEINGMYEMAMASKEK